MNTKQRTALLRVTINRLNIIKSELEDEYKGGETFDLKELEETLEIALKNFKTLNRDANRKKAEDARQRDQSDGGGILRADEYEE